MDAKITVENLYTELRENLNDIKCEALLNHALGSGLRKDDFVVLNNGHFFREYRPDVYGVEMLEDTWMRQALQLRLSRNGLYDLLPEGIFHQPLLNRNNVISAAEMAAASKADRHKENTTRKFFQPVENGLFMQRLEIEQVEERMLTAIEDGMLTDYFFEFWGLPATLNHESAMLIIFLLPYAHIIAGNVPLMQQCLGVLLNEKVKIEIKDPAETLAQQAGRGLGGMQLGNDMVCGNSFFEDYTCLQYNIGALQNSTPASYVPGGANDVLLQTFNNFFAPVEADVEINIEIDRFKATIELSETNGSILGYSSVL
jgi:Type VI secretion, TssG